MEEGHWMDLAFHKNLSELRHRSGKSQRQVAADLGISQALLSHYENGAREPGLAFVCRVCDYYGVTADYLLGRSDNRDAISMAEALALVDALRALTDQAESIIGKSTSNRT